MHLHNPLIMSHLVNLKPPNRPWLLATPILLFIFFSFCRPESPPGHFRGPTMGTSFSIQWHGAAPNREPDPTPVLKKKIWDILKEQNRLFSTYQSDSVINRFNDLKANQPFPVPPDFCRVLHQALRLSALSRGAYDITSGPLIRFWGFDRQSTENLSQLRALAPAKLKTKIRDIQQRMGWKNLVVTPTPKEGCQLTKKIPGLEINLSSLAKGFAVDKVGDFLTEQGFSNWLVEIGGEIRVRGKNPSGKKWRVGIVHPSPNPAEQTVDRELSLAKGCVATSGTYRNFHQTPGKGGRPQSHILNARDGHPVEHSLVSVSILASDCLRADAWATVLTILGPKMGGNLFREKENAKNGFGYLQIIRSNPWSEPTPRFKYESYQWPEPPPKQIP